MPWRWRQDGSTTVIEPVVGVVTGIAAGLAAGITRDRRPIVNADGEKQRLIRLCWRLPPTACDGVEVFSEVSAIRRPNNERMQYGSAAFHGVKYDIDCSRTLEMIFIFCRYAAFSHRYKFRDVP